jgi:hypothetical protein
LFYDLKIMTAPRPLILKKLTKILNFTVFLRFFQKIQSSLLKRLVNIFEKINIQKPSEKNFVKSGHPWLRFLFYLISEGWMLFYFKRHLQDGRTSQNMHYLFLNFWKKTEKKLKFWILGIFFKYFRPRHTQKFKKS